MARGEEAIENAMQAIANAVTVEQLRQAQAVVLPLRFAMSLQQTAEVTRLSVGWVSKQRNRFIQGKAVGDGFRVLVQHSLKFTHRHQRSNVSGTKDSVSVLTLPPFTLKVGRAP